MFENRNALITGASSGIGRELARCFARRGARLILVARREDRLRALAAEVASPGREPVVIAADLRDDEACQRVIDDAIAATGRIDVLVNNAGIGEYGRFAHKNLDATLDVMRLNMTAVVRLTRAVLPAMIDRGEGWILNLASTAAFQPTPYMAVYGASKSFVRDFSLALWEEVRRKGVGVTCVCPGPVRTEFLERGGYEVFRVKASRVTADPARVAEAAVRALERRRAILVPGLGNALTTFMARFVPLTWVTRIAGRVLRGA